MQLCLVCLNYLLKVQCAVTLFLTHRTKVHSQTGSHCKLSALSNCISLSAISVLCYCWLLLCGLWPWALPLSLHTPFVPAVSQSFHRPSASSPSGEWSSRPNRTGELLLAESEISLGSEEGMG